jgi:hypothetical protein
MRRRATDLLVFSLVLALALGFALYTRHSWEDWFIAFRSSRNLAAGNGLVYTPGERVQAFSSPLGALVPALLALALPGAGDDTVLWLYRALGAALLAGAAVLLARVCRCAGLGAFPAAVAVALLATDAKTLDFSVNGMETPFMLAFLAATLYVLACPVRRFVPTLGLCWAALLWTRPDSFVYFVGIALGYLAFLPPSPHFATRRELLGKLLRAAPIAAAFYAPWVAWAWIYYGSPVPHSIVAKGLHLQGALPALAAKLATFPLHLPFGGPAADTFLPPLHWLGGWPGWLAPAGATVALGCAYGWLVPWLPRLGRALSFALCLAYFYLSNVVTFVGAWYIPSVTLLCALVIGSAAHAGEAALARRAPGEGRPWPRRVGLAAVRAALGALLLAGAGLTVAVAREVKVQQEVVEDQGRRQVGAWLARNAASPRDTVFLEPLGYIGYHSGLKMYDFPGIASPEVVRARRALGTDDFAPLIARLEPDWLVLRPAEIAAVEAQAPALLAGRYAVAQVFDLTALLAPHRDLPGFPLLDWDRVLVVYRRRPAGGR